MVTDAAGHYGQRAYRQLAVIIKKGNIPHALLFTGIEGTGKRSAALSLAMACNCNADKELMASSAAVPLFPCSVCKPCRKIKTGNHPDVHIIEPDGRFIKIDQIRSIISVLDMRPVEARWRFVLITDSQLMNPEAGNALLKMLEEPPQQTVLILTASQKSGLLPTIVSRCRELHFNPIARAELARWLKEQQQISTEHAQTIALMAHGSFTKAHQLTDADLFHKKNNRRNWLVAQSGLTDQPANISIPHKMAFAEKIAQDKDSLIEDLDTLYIWLRDLIMGKYVPQRVINTDAAETMRCICSSKSVETLLNQIRIIEWARKALLKNANPRLTLEAMMIKLMKTA